MEEIDRKEKRRKISEWFIFSWQPDKNTFRTVMAFGIFSAVIHFMGFYLFQVVYPEPVRAELTPNRITLLDPRDDDVKSYLDRIRDRAVFLEPASTSALSQVKLSDQAIRFVPSFADAKPTLKRPGVAEEEATFPIPEVPNQDIMRNWNNRVEFSDHLAKRGIAPNTVFDDYLDLIPNLPKIRVNLTILPSGIPSEVRIVGNQFGESKQILERDIKRFLRFNPISPEKGNYPGWIEILGKRASER